MWEAMMMLRLIASIGPGVSLGNAGRGLSLPGRAIPLTLPADTLKGAVRLTFAAWRLSLPIAERADNHRLHDGKTL